MTNLVYQPSKTTHWKNLFPNKMLLLGSQNLNEGEELVAEITAVDIEDIRDQNGNTEKVPVIKFTNAPPMVLNITNTRTIASLYGELYDGWAGKAIQIFATKVKAFGKEEMALRIRDAIPDTGQDVSRYEKALHDAKTMTELKDAFMSIPKHLKPRLTDAKNIAKEKLSADQ